MLLQQHGPLQIWDVIYILLACYLNHSNRKLFYIGNYCINFSWKPPATFELCLNSQGLLILSRGIYLDFMYPKIPIQLPIVRADNESFVHF